MRGPLEIENKRNTASSTQMLATIFGRYGRKTSKSRHSLVGPLWDKLLCRTASVWWSFSRWEERNSREFSVFFSNAIANRTWVPIGRIRTGKIHNRLFMSHKTVAQTGSPSRAHESWNAISSEKGFVFFFFSCAIFPRGHLFSLDIISFFHWCASQQLRFCLSEFSFLFRSYDPTQQKGHFSSPYRGLLPPVSS